MDLINFEYKRMSQYLANEQITLTPQQKEAYGYMAQGKNIFLTGPGGCGKSTLLKLFKRQYNGTRIISITALTGCAAILINGTTLHSYLGIGLGTASEGALVTKISKKQYLRKRWTQLETLIIDEISHREGNGKSP